MAIQFLNVDLVIESAGDLHNLVDELNGDFSLSIHAKNNQGNNFAVLSHRSACDNYELNAIFSLFCASLEKLSPKARDIWDSCLRKTFDAGFESGDSPNDFQTEIRPEIIKKVSEFDASISITIYPYK
jgi:hypothetical protein